MEAFGKGEKRRGINLRGKWDFDIAVGCDSVDHKGKRMDALVGSAGVVWTIPSDGAGDARGDRACKYRRRKDLSAEA